MPYYETVFIIDLTIGPDEIAKEIANVEATVSSAEGRIIGRDDKGKLRLAYPIAHKTEGHYVYLTFEGQGTIIPVLERVYRLNERILRFLTLRLEAAPPEPAPAAEPAAESPEPTTAADSPVKDEKGEAEVDDGTETDAETGAEEEADETTGTEETEADEPADREDKPEDKPEEDDSTEKETGGE